MVYHRSEASANRADRNRSARPPASQPAVRNAFRNDGSFLEMFKKMQEAGGSGQTAAPRARADAPSGSAGPAAGHATEDGPAVGPGGLSASALTAKKPAPPIVGKRRGGRVLPTGLVKKKRTDEEDEEDKPKDAWSLYMAEVRRYKETSCEEDGKTRPLVK